MCLLELDLRISFTWGLVKWSWWSGVEKNLFVRGQTNTLGFVDCAVSGITNATVVLETGKENN